MDFAQVIKEIRLKSLLSQEALAKELCVSFSTVNRWETGKSKPRYEALKKLKEFCEKNSIPFEISDSYLPKQNINI